MASRTLTETFRTIVSCKYALCDPPSSLPQRSYTGLAPALLLCGTIANFWLGLSAVFARRDGEAAEALGRRLAELRTTRVESVIITLRGEGKMQ